MDVSWCADAMMNAAAADSLRGCRESSVTLSEPAAGRRVQPPEVSVCRMPETRLAVPPAVYPRGNVEATGSAP